MNHRMARGLKNFVTFTDKFGPNLISQQESEEFIGAYKLANVT